MTEFSPGPVTVHLAPVVVTMTGEPLHDAGVVVTGDRIAAVGTRARLLPPYAGAKVREWPGVMTPGLVNAHAHLEYGPPFADLATAGLPFAQWIQELTRRRRLLSAADWLASARGSVSELLSSGTTCVADVVTHGAGLVAAARAALAGISYVEAVGADDARWPAERERVDQVIASAPRGRDIGISPHALYTLSSSAYRSLLDLARSTGRRSHTHLAETAEEAEYVLRGAGPMAEHWRSLGLEFDLLDGGSGRSPAAHLDAIGGLGPDVHVAHGVHLDRADRALLREKGTAVALCARSNRVLGAGDPPVAALLAEVSPIAVGTDSLASSPSLDLLDELAALHRLATSQGAEPDGLSEQLVAAATVGGAVAMGLEGAAGVLAPGVRANFAVFDVPVTASPYDALVAHGGGRCVLTVVGGRLVHRRSSLRAPA